MDSKPTMGLDLGESTLAKIKLLHILCVDCAKEIFDRVGWKCWKDGLLHEAMSRRLAWEINERANGYGTIKPVTKRSNDRKQILLEMIDWVSLAHGVPRDNQPMNGYIGRNGIAALHTGVAINRHYRKLAGIKGSICKINSKDYSDEFYSKNRRLSVFERKKEALEMISSHIADDIESADKHPDFPPVMFSWNLPYRWIQNLLDEHFKHHLFPLKMRLIHYRYSKKLRERWAA